MVEKRGNQHGESSDVGIGIKYYGSLFSDFDSRPYSQKLLSEDLLREINRVVKHKNKGEFELKLLVQKKVRNLREEKVIKKRLKEHFKNHLFNIEKLKKKSMVQGALFILFGVLFMIIATFFLINPESSYLITFLSVLSEPAGWFLFWEGLNILIFDIKKSFPEIEFYKKMSKVQIKFADFE